MPWLHMCNHGRLSCSASIHTCPLHEMAYTHISTTVYMLGAGGYMTVHENVYWRANTSHYSVGKHGAKCTRDHRMVAHMKCVTLKGACGKPRTQWSGEVLIVHTPACNARYMLTARCMRQLRYTHGLCERYR